MALRRALKRLNAERSAPMNGMTVAVAAMISIDCISVAPTFTYLPRCAVYGLASAQHCALPVAA
jgi:hypothetical protein